MLDSSALATLAFVVCCDELSAEMYAAAEANYADAEEYCAASGEYYKVFAVC